ncbi:hypothetical protein B0H15DRAFT_204577 [Mycena belliarum]|uniref:Uncharacterized protein n=1 Tax=Mycena belliarum TaxID=1033014 RepID=A0AAD6ULN7_9AGAR|nr:hypothetical protein B0H15DRAFT_204577 [Mycena belliae]
MSNINDPILRLSLSNNAALEYVLADIPFFCVGLTALAIFAFFIVMRRVNLPTIFLYISSLLAFVAAILDLTQILLRGTANTDAGLAMDTVTGIANTREVGLALAFGFRFLYLWKFVAQRPRFEPRPREADLSPSDSPFHSASWERWGVPGFILKYALLGSVIAIPILQIIWRIATGLSSVYLAEATIQIAVSALLIAKLLLNLHLSTVSPWWRPFTPYIVPILALMISTGIGTGNLLIFKFSETTLGRFLQAMETYSLIISLLIFTFYKVPQVTPEDVRASRKRSSFFTGFAPKGEELGGQVPAPVEELPTIFIGRAMTSIYYARSSRESALSRLSSWMNVRSPPRSPPRPGSGEKSLWNSGDAELGISTELRATTPEIYSEGQLSPLVEVRDEKRSPTLGATTTEPKNSSPRSLTLEVGTPSTANRPFTGVSFASYYGMATGSRLTIPASSTVPGDDSRGTASPVYGLNGIIAASAPAVPDSATLSRRPPSSPPPTVLHESVTSFDELLRQQTELDRSIAALRLFSPTTTVMDLPPPPEPEMDDSRTNAEASSRSFSVSSNKSEFSLSIFPEPPPVGELPESLVSGRARASPFPVRARRQSRLPLSAVSPGADEEPSAPASPGHMRFASAGTQYDVTSFIGDLTSPAEPRMGALGEVAETESDMESPVISTVTPALRPLLLSTTAVSLTSLPPATASSTLLPASSQQSSYEYPALRPLFLGSTTGASASSPLSAGARRMAAPSVFNGPRRPSRPGQARPVISIPRQMDDEPDEEAEAFEKPRRPPALTALQQDR